MGLKGNLSTVNLADVFQVLSRGNSTGLLRIQAPEGPRFVEIQNGAISIAGRSGGRILLGDLLLSRGLVDEQRLEAALQAQREGGKLLGQILLDNQTLAREALEEALRFQIEEEVCELFTLGKGDFDFLAGATLDAKIAPGGGLVRLKIDPNSLLLEAARRADEWKAIEARISSQSLLFRLSPQGSELLKSGAGLSPEGLVLLKLVEDNRSIESMVQKACMGRLNTNQMMLELWDAGLVDPMPFDAYFKAAQGHLKAGRIDEAQRLAEVTVSAGASSDKQKAVSMLAEIDKARKASISGTMAATTDPKVRSEVIRRASPNLILKKERRVLPFVIVGLVLLLGGGGAGAYFMFFSGSKANLNYRNLLNQQINEADTAIREQDYSKGLELLRKFHSNDPDTQDLATKKYVEHRKDVEAMLELAIEKFKAAYGKGNAEDLKTAADELDKFVSLVFLSDAAQKDLATTRSLLDQYKNKERLDATRTQLHDIDAGARSRAYAALKQAYEKLLAQNPPEEVAVEVRDKLSRLIKARADSETRLRLASAEKDAGEYDSAKSLLESVKRDGPGSDTVSKAATGIEAIDKDAADFQKKLDRVEVLQTQKSIVEAKAELLKIIEGHPPDRSFIAALDALHTLSAEPEPDLEKELNQALQLQESKPAECRMLLLDLLKKAPWSKTASKIALQIVINSDPAGAEVQFNGRPSGKTPAPLTIPAIGLAHISLKKTGYQPEEIVEFNLRKDVPPVVLKKLSVASRRMPVPAAGGLAVNAECLVILGEGEADICAPADLKVQSRVALKIAEQPKPLAAMANGQALTLLPDAALVSLVGKGIAKIKLPGGECVRMGAQAVTSAPLVYTSPELGVKTVIATATVHGVDCEFLEDGALHKSIELNKESSPPWGLAAAGDVLLVPREDAVYAVSGASAASGAQLWQAPVEGKIAGGPVLCSKVFAVLTAAGWLYGFASDTGDKRFLQDVGSPGAVSVPITAMSKGFLTAAKDGKLTLSSPDKGAAVWSVTLPSELLLAPVALRAKESDPESAIAVCYKGKDGYVLAALSASNGAVQWTTDLSAKPVALAAYGERIYVSTADGDVIAYDLN